MGKFRQFLTDCLPGTHNSGGVLWFHVSCPCVHPSVHPSVVSASIFSFPDDYLGENGFSPNLACAWIF